MKLRKIETLLRAVGARTRLEQSGLAAIKRVQESLIADAGALRAAARAPLDGTAGLAGGDLAVYGRNQARLEQTADGRVAMAQSLEPQKAACAAALKASLRKELAWAALAGAARDAGRRALNDREEERREALIHMRRSESE